MDLAPILSIKKLNFYYVKHHSLKDISFDIFKGKITAVIGPSGSGKSTLIRCFNRIYELTPKVSIKGSILFKGKNILDSSTDVTELRQKIGMVFQKPTPFPMSIEKNVAFGLKFAKKLSKSETQIRVKESLQQSALWDEVSSKLNTAGNYLSGGQQQRLCVARTLAMQPEVLLLDEPTSSLDPISGRKIESVVKTLKDKYTIVIVTHNLKQAERLSDYTVFMKDGVLVEYQPTDKFFQSPVHEETKRYLTYQD